MNTSKITFKLENCLRLFFVVLLSEGEGFKFILYCPY
jgi:hypothetical protein